MSSDQSRLNVISFNMHGFYQGFSFIDHLIKYDAPDIFLLQEHWLTPTTLDNFDKFFQTFLFSVVLR